MCGIVGMAGDIEVADRAVFRDLLDVCQTRGRDSTGAIMINRAQSYSYVKEVGPPTYLFDRRAYSTHIESGMHAAFIGHCRHKTVGEVSRSTAHPFEYEEEGIIGVHNGTLRNYHNLDGHAYGKVDSDVLYGHLAKNGPEETFNRLEGAWACVWWDEEAETLNFIRNDERPLFFCWSEDRRKMYWASSVWMLQSIQAEKRVKMWEGPKGDGTGKYISLPVDTLWSFSIHPAAKKGDATLTMKPAKKIERKKLVISGPKPWEGNGRGFAGSSVFNKTAQSIWNSKSSQTHTWDATVGKWVEKMTFSAWEKIFNERKSKGGSVPDPFQKLDDQLPVHLRPRPDTLALIQGGKTDTGNSKPKSTPPSKNGADSQTALTSSKSGEQNTNSLVPPSSTDSQKTNRKRFSNALKNLQQGNGGSQSINVSFRVVAGEPYVTDENTGTEYSVHQVQENTQGCCSFCDEPIGDLTEIAEFFGKNKFICVHCVEPSVRSVA